MTNGVQHTPDQEEVSAILREARLVRAQEIAALVGVAGRAVVNGFSRIGRALVGMAEAIEAGRRAQLLHSELSRMSDQQLSEAGIARDDIPVLVARAVAGLDREPAQVIGEIGPANEAPAVPEAGVREAA